MNICLKHLFAIFEKIRIFHDGSTRQAHVSKNSKDQRIHQANLSSSQLKGLSPMDEEHELLVGPGGDESGMSQPLEMIVVKKEREEEYDQEIDNQWKEARSNFYNHTIQQKLTQAKIKQKYQKQIFQLFIQAKEKQWLRGQIVQLAQKRNLWKCIFGSCGKAYHPSVELRQYQQQINQLNQSLQLINSQFYWKQKATPSITQIIQLKYTSLKVINIQYSLNIYQRYRYQVSAFTLFKVVHENRGLSSVTLKGIKVSEFKQFLRANTQSKLNQIQEQKNEEFRWMKDFTPLKSLKIAIDTLGYFQLTNKEKDVCAIRDLALFGAMFEQLGIISVNINLEEWKQLTTVSNTWQQFWKLIKIIGKIKTNVTLNGGFHCDSDQPFTALLQMVSFLTISQLSFINIIFNSQVSINRFLAMQQILRTIFESNTVTSLTLNNCRNFPIFPTITTLQSICLCLWQISFRRKFNFFIELTKSCPSLISIKGYSKRYNSSVKDKLFSRLQQLSIQQCFDINLGLSIHSPSNIKHLSIRNLSIRESYKGLSVLFPKLAHLTQLALYRVSIDHKLICSISSPHLAFLRMIENGKFATQGLKAIDKKWPKLRQLSLWDCPELNENGWSACEFKGVDRFLNISSWASNQTIAKREGNTGISMIKLRDYHSNLQTFYLFHFIKATVEDFIWSNLDSNVAKMLSFDGSHETLSADFQIVLNECKYCTQYFQNLLDI